MDALVVGEALVDVIETGTVLTARPGGSSANVAVALARLGRSVGLATCFADDEHGRSIARWLAEAGVEVAGDPHVVPRTSTALARIGADGAASYLFDLEWRLGPAPEVDPLVVHTSSLGAVVEPGATQVLALLERLRDRATISYDINARPQVTGTGPEIQQRVETMIRLADVVKASDEDVEALWPEATVAAVAERVLGHGAAVFVVTRGDHGIEWYAAGDSGRIPAVPTVVADTIGAGDTVSAGLVDGLWERGLLGAAHRPALPAAPWADVVAWAARLAAVTVSRPGADPPWRHEVG